MDIVSEVSSRIDAHLEASGQSPSGFGKSVAKDGSFLPRLKAGRVTLMLAQKALDFIVAFQERPAANSNEPTLSAGIGPRDDNAGEKVT